MNIYCRNNPVMYADPTGESWEEIGAFLAGFAVAVWAAMVEYSPAYAGCVGLAGADGPLPFGDALGVVGAVVITAVAVGRGVYQATQSNSTSISIPKVEEKEKTVNPPNKVPVTKIYRYGGTNPGNLTPKAKDSLTGLSFSMIPPLPGTPASVTTIEALNATGKLVAFNDRPNHVSVIPAPHMGTLKNWIDTGSSHPCTAAVKSAVVKWDGVI